MNSDQSMRDVEFLLNLYPEVSSARVVPRENNKVFVRFNCNSFESLKEICYNATYSNLGIEVGTIENRKYDDLYFCISICESDVSGIPPSTLEIFGVFLASDLYTKGLLPVTRTNELLKRWNASAN